MIDHSHLSQTALLFVLLYTAPSAFAQDRAREEAGPEITPAVATAVSPLAPTALPAPASSSGSESPSGTSAPDANDSGRSGLGRWLDLEIVTVGLGYLYGDDGTGAAFANQPQHQVTVQGRFTFDADGKYSVVGALTTGGDYANGWNDLGLGGAKGDGRVYLKSLYVAAKPAAGVEIDYGSLPVLQGRWSGMPSYSGYTYLTGARVVLEKPSRLFFDQVAVTYGYLGDFDSPGSVSRLHRLGKANYHQFLVTKSLGDRATVSVDYTSEAGVARLREAVTVNIGKVRFVDSVCLDAYQRLDGDRAAGFTVGVQKAISSRVTLGGGYSQIDPNYSYYNADGTFSGRRVFLSVNAQLAPDLSLALYTDRAFKNGFVVPGRNYLNVTLNYDVLSALRRSGLFR